MAPYGGCAAPRRLPTRVRSSRPASPGTVAVRASAAEHRERPAIPLTWTHLC
ncbi:hypothetical protein TVNIR_2897 [Thioalkalivibrio nitratireducens DSM 14787]|uniref:Uncharacterized protein n=1 Tax=Thioalkalivibrio nitratireducens (strain DSM 14787 / UNIQEM 213 / ALEN2) TaxID=1255043 RepID=L0DY54_THIND|nr:hypothetical protein TVNIR_2897 [Thioalkalivibrio nitratireducens DSM 14787]